MYISKTLTATLLISIGLLIGTIGETPVFASLCQVSDITYNYPEQVKPSQSFRTTVTLSGTCAINVEYYYSIRVDLSDTSNRILSSHYAPIGYGNGQKWQVTVPNPLTAPRSTGAWQVQFNVYVFASISSGGTPDFQTIKTITIQVGM